MLCGFPPFYEENNDKLFERIRKGDFDFPSPHWDAISNEAKDLVTKLLTTDPKKRITADQILAHPWIKGEKVSNTNIPNIQERVKAFNSKKKQLKKTGTAL